MVNILPDCLLSSSIPHAQPAFSMCCFSQAYNEKQVQQLTRLIEVTRTDLSKADRQKVGSSALASVCLMQRQHLSGMT